MYFTVIITNFFVKNLCVKKKNIPNYFIIVNYIIYSVFGYKRQSCLWIESLRNFCAKCDDP